MDYNREDYSLARYLDPLYPDEYLDWEKEVEKYFACTKMSEWEKVRVAIRELTRHAKWRREDIEDEYYRRGDKVIAWKSLRSRLREKYLGRSYEQKLVDQWYQLEQGNQTVSEYFDQFNQHAKLMRTVGTKYGVLTRFQGGLRRDIQWELSRWKITTLEEAFRIAKDFELHQISTSKPARVNSHKSNPRPSTMPLDQPAPTAPSQVQGPRPVDPTPQSIPDTPLIQSTAIPIVDQEDTQIDKIGGKSSEPIVDYIEEVYEPDQDLIDQYIEKEEIVLEEQPGCGEDSPTISEALPEISLEKENLERNDLDITLLERSLEPVEDVEIGPETQKQYETFEDLFLSSPSPQEESNLVVPFEDLFPEINDLSSHRMSLPVPTIHFPTQGQFLGFRLISFIPRTIPETSFYLPLPQPAHVSRMIKHQFAEVARISQVREPIQFATYFWRTLWHLLEVHVTFSAAHHQSTRGQA